MMKKCIVTNAAQLKRNLEMGRSIATPTDAIELCYVDVSEIAYDECTGCEDWDYYMDDLQEQIGILWPSMDPETNDKWLDNEIKVLTKNSLAFVTISEYCGLACIALVPRFDEGQDNISIHWCNQIAEKFQKAFGQFIKTGTMSNGCSVYKNN